MLDRYLMRVWMGCTPSYRLSYSPLAAASDAVLVVVDMGPRMLAAQSPTAHGYDSCDSPMGRQADFASLASHDIVFVLYCTGLQRWTLKRTIWLFSVRRVKKGLKEVCLCPGVRADR